MAVEKLPPTGLREVISLVAERAQPVSFSDRQFELRPCTHKSIWSKAAGNVRYSTLCELNSDLARGPRRAKKRSRRQIANLYSRVCPGGSLSLSRLKHRPQ